jgi:hypothetical protein
VRDTDLVVCNGVEMQARMAASLGYIERTATGYRDLGQAAPATAPQAPPVGQAAPAQEAATAPPLTAEASAARQSLRAALPGSMLDHVVSTVITEGVDAVSASVASDAGVSAAELHDNLRKATAGMFAQVSTVLARKGVEAADFTQWAQQHAKADLQDAMRQHWYAGDTSRYTDLAERYLRSNPPTTQSMKDGGLDTFWDRQTRQQMIRIAGTTMSVKVAARMGLI